MEQVIRNALLPKVPIYPKIGDDSWQHPPVSCACGDCNKHLNKFLVSPAESTWNFTAGEPRRRHIEQVLETSKSPPRYTLQTIKSGSPYTLKVVKLMTQNAISQSTYKQAVDRLIMDMFLLQSRGTKMILGEDKYSELVMLDKLKKPLEGAAKISTVTPHGVKRGSSLAILEASAIKARRVS